MINLQQKIYELDALNTSVASLDASVANHDASIVSLDSSVSEIASSIQHIVSMSEADYNAMESHDQNTFYFLT